MDPEIRLSPTIANILVSRSPLHAWQEHWLLGGTKREPTDAMEKGIALDSLILGSGKDRIVSVDAADWRTKAAQESRAAIRAEGKVPILIHKMEELRKTAEVISSGLAEKNIFFNGKTQLKLEWEHEGVKCKGKLDHFIEKDAYIYDLKCVENAEPGHCIRSMTQYGYDIQYASYTQGVGKNFSYLAGKTKMLFLFCEVEPPNAISIIELAGSLMELGNRRWNRAVSTWGQCLASNKWPSYGQDDVIRAEAYPWQIQAEFEKELESYGGSEERMAIENLGGLR